MMLLYMISIYTDYYNNYLSNMLMVFFVKTLTNLFNVTICDKKLIKIWGDMTSQQTRPILELLLSVLCNYYKIEKKQADSFDLIMVP